jgi:hypothetical protein
MSGGFAPKVSPEQKTRRSAQKLLSVNYVKKVVLHKNAPGARIGNVGKIKGTGNNYGKGIVNHSSL